MREVSSAVISDDGRTAVAWATYVVPFRSRDVVVGQVKYKTHYRIWYLSYKHFFFYCPVDISASLNTLDLWWIFPWNSPVQLTQWGSRSKPSDTTCCLILGPTESLTKLFLLTYIDAVKKLKNRQLLSLSIRNYVCLSSAGKIVVPSDCSILCNIL